MITKNYKYCKMERISTPEAETESAQETVCGNQKRKRPHVKTYAETYAKMQLGNWLARIQYHKLQKLKRLCGRSSSVDAGIQLILPLIVPLLYKPQ
jgi:hypothetical protein